MNDVNKTLYIPLYGKAFVSKRGLFLKDTIAETIWEKEGFALKGKVKSKWLAYYMGIRSAVFDEWIGEQMKKMPNAVVIHIGCGLDSRAMRISHTAHAWFDVDFESVIEERGRYFSESNDYKMIAGDVRESAWLDAIYGESAIVVIEGVSMYLKGEELNNLFLNLSARFSKISLLVDCYTDFGARASKYKNPINTVGVTEVYGVDNPKALDCGRLAFLCEHNMTPQKYINELSGAEKHIFKILYAGGVAKKIYRLYEYCK